MATSSKVTIKCAKTLVSPRDAGCPASWLKMPEVPQPCPSNEAMITGQLVIGQDGLVPAACCGSTAAQSFNQINMLSYRLHV